ncbi:uncharacterized protein LOC134267561 [Saccostrea cucullata]|uniref:uncharacterized protein LOC134267561 n=1 Tax=Saccostrea cuccullata TaxID=36930 RepID=UPI002ED18749
MDPSTSAQDVTRCDICETAIVQMHCDTCLANLCKACVGDHISTDENRGHKVVNFQSRRTTPMYPDCAFHVQEQCEMYCRHCDVSVCPTCLASDRHLGHKLSKFLHVLSKKKDLIRKEQIKFNETIYPSYQDFATDVQNRMSQLKKECGDLLISIANHGEYWHSSLQNIAFYRNSRVWISKKNSTIKLYSINQESPLVTIRTASGNMPADIAVSRNDELIYFDDKDKTVNTIKNADIMEVIRFRNWKPRRVCCASSGELLIIMENDEKQSKVARYSGSTEKQSIQSDNKGNALFSSGDFDKYICENRNLDICVADRGAKAVVVVNQAGKLRFKYKGHTPKPRMRPFCPTGITKDSQGNVLTSDENNNCIHIINEDGHFSKAFGGLEACKPN